MKYLYTVSMISILILSGCTSNATVKEIRQENEQLKQENVKLSEKYEELKSNQLAEDNQSKGNLDKLNIEMNTLQAENENQKEMITKYEEAFERLQADSNILVEHFSIFSPDKVQIGSQIAGLKVTDIKKEAENGATSFYLDFKGEFEVRGSIIHNQIGGSKYSFMVEDSLEKLPHTLYEFVRNKVYFEIKDDVELEKALGDKLKNLSPFGELEITGVFKNYSYNYVPQTDVSNKAEFVRLLSQN
jgi:outer membrane murein-binding lipoprotein Lpp